jgi:hypothetical protein
MTGAIGLALQRRVTEQVGVEPVLAYTVWALSFITALFVGYYLGTRYVA